ncbi:MAG TPA: HD domain-containing protein [Gemmatimonadaceae bacterium]|nr:HD domain-containing protein [Gemmatimonadaceae bacterium]
MSTTGYSDRVNHAFAFAAKHHDTQVRKGTALPYLTRPPNVAVILTRYGQPEDTVLAGILHSVVEGSVRDGFTRDELDDWIGAKFGSHVLETALAVAERRTDDSGVELSPEERKADAVARLAAAPEAARWVCAADALHSASTILADLKRTEYPETVWARTHRGREGTIRWYRHVYDRLVTVGFSALIMGELAETVEALERRGTAAVAQS